MDATQTWGLQNGSATMLYPLVQLTLTQLLPYSTDRRAIIVGPPAANAVQLFWDASAGAALGIRLTAGQPPLVLDKSTYGALVTYPLFALMETAPGVVPVAVESWK